MSDVKSSKFKKIARIRDKATDTYIEVIQFPISKTEMGKIELAPSVVNELSGFEKKLRDAGAVLPKDKIAIKNLLEDLAKSDAPRQWVYESKTGWTADRSGYVLRTGFIGNSNIQILGSRTALTRVVKVSKPRRLGRRKIGETPSASMLETPPA